MVFGENYFNFILKNKVMDEYSFNILIDIVFRYVYINFIYLFIKGFI